MTDLGSLAIGSLLGLAAVLALRRRWPLYLVFAVLLGAAGALIGGWFADRIFASGEDVEWISTAIGALIAISADATISRGIGHPNDPET